MKPNNINKRRKQIFEASVKVIAEHGFHDATIEKIAQAADMGKGTMYQYIRKKGDIILLIAEEGIALLSEKIGDVTASKASPEKKLQGIIDAELSLIQENDKLAKTIALEMERINTEELSRIHEMYITDFLEAFKSHIEEFLPNKYFDKEDALLLSDILTATCFMWAHSNIIQKHAGDVERYKRILSHLFLYGLAKKETETVTGGKAS
ncbi:MAG TPA: TetR/AcrR family transcriptional regulator [bacterium]|nr:TetR/AcrR family transcriptional regulator [bacterium]